MDIKKVVREQYGRAARLAAQNPGGRSGWSHCCEPVTGGLYDAAEQASVPDTAAAASLGCGNPTALAGLFPGATVLDLGSGGGMDVLLAARQVGPAGRVYGLDMTDEMLALARVNQEKAGLTNVEFLKGEIENIPLPENTVDVIISNCVINLAGDKDRVLREAFRVLKPGGRLAVSDLVTRGQMPEELRQGVLLWAGCIAGALDESAYYRKLTAAGFTNIDMEATRVYRVSDILRFFTRKGWEVSADRSAGERAAAREGRLVSVFIQAIKPALKPAVKP